MNRTKILLVVTVVLLIISAFLGARYYNVYQESNRMQKLIVNYDLDSRVLVFTDLFISEVLRAEKDIDFETRLKLENAVRELDNENISTAWKNFVDSETEEEAQQNVEALLSLLITEIMKK